MHACRHFWGAAVPSRIGTRYAARSKPAAGGAASTCGPYGATSLRWLRALLDHDIEVHGPVVVCPGINDGTALEGTLAGLLDRLDALDATLVVESPPGRGTTVRAELPCES